MNIGNTGFRIANRLFGQKGKNRLLQSLTRASLQRHNADSEAFERMQFFVEGVCGLRPLPPVHPMQSDRWYYPGLSATPFPDATDLDWIPELEARWRAIRAECESLEKKGLLRGHQQGYLTPSGRWDTFYLTGTGIPLSGMTSICPTTCSALSSIQATHGAGPAYFSIMRPGTKVAPHHGPFNYRLRCHLGLSIPEQCGIQVGEETRRWQEGKCLVLDDSLLHSVWNDATQSRVVLLFDFWHPDLSLAEQKTLQLLDSITGSRDGYLENIEKIQGEAVRAHLARRGVPEQA